MAADADVRRVLVGAQKRQRRVAPFGGRAVLAGQHAPVDDDAAAHARPQRRAEHDVGPRTIQVGGRRRRAVDRLGEHEALAVVGEANGPPERRRQIAIQWPIVEAGEVRVQHHAAARVQHARRADADRRGRRRARHARLEPPDHAGDRLQDVVVSGRRSFAVPRQLTPVVAQRDAFDLRATDVDADSHAPTISPGRPPNNPRRGRASAAAVTSCFRLSRPKLAGCVFWFRGRSGRRVAGVMVAGAAIAGRAGADVHDVALHLPARLLSRGRRRGVCRRPSIAWISGPRSRSGSKARTARCSSTR